MRSAWHPKATWLAVAAVLAAPGGYQLALMIWTIARRFWYPFDLEWMEGGMLEHALRLVDGQSLYAPPSVDFISYLYTPGYPALLAALHPFVGLSYQTGRAVSVLALILTLAIVGKAAMSGDGSRADQAESRAVRVLAAIGALGLIAAAYPWVEGWYDLVRGDTLFLGVGTLGLWWLYRAAHASRRRFWNGQVAACAAVLALSFFIKQTGVLLVIAGGASLIWLNGRALATYVPVAGVIGLFGTWLGNRMTGGWFWTYVFAYHQQHDTHLPRFWLSFKLIFGQFPVVVVLVVVALVWVIRIAVTKRTLPASTTSFLYWAWMYLCGVLIGALGFATQWAHFNAYIPALVFGAIACARAIVVLVDCARELAAPAQRSWARALTGGLALTAVGAQLLLAHWSPADFIPRDADARAGEKLIARLIAANGPVLVPSHPWYAHLADKPTFAHRMGMLDVTSTRPGQAPLAPAARRVDRLADLLQARHFALVVLDDRQPPSELPGLTRFYELDTRLPTDEQPRVYSGARTRPVGVWRPRRP